MEAPNFSGGTLKASDIVVAIVWYIVQGFRISFSHVILWVCSILLVQVVIRDTQTGTHVFLLFVCVTLTINCFVSEVLLPIDRVSFQVIVAILGKLCMHILELQFLLATGL